MRFPFPADLLVIPAGGQSLFVVYQEWSVMPNRCFIDPYKTLRRAGRFFSSRVRFPCRRRGPPSQAT